MNLTKQQKIVGAVLVLAVVAIGVDRFVIGHDDPADLVASEVTPRPAAARRPVARQAKPVAVAAATPAAEAGFGNLGALAGRLENLRLGSEAKGQAMNLEAVRDAFRPPPSMVTSRKVETVDELQDAAKRFVERHKLAAVVKRQSGRGVAIIEDRTATSGSITVAVGQKLNGFTLVTVQDRVAILRRGAQRVELRLQEDPNAGTITHSEKMVATDPLR